MAWYGAIGMTVLVGLLVFLTLLWRAWRTAVKAVDRMVKAINDPIILSAKTPIENVT